MINCCDGYTLISTAIVLIADYLKGVEKVILDSNL
jgi:hypothetical protein